MCVCVYVCVCVCVCVNILVYFGGQYGLLDLKLARRKSKKTLANTE